MNCCLQVKQQVLAGRCPQKSCDDFLKQMGYREYSRYISYHFPFTHERALLEHVQACPWNYDRDHFKVWKVIRLWEEVAESVSHPFRTSIIGIERTRNSPGTSFLNISELGKLVGCKHQNEEVACSHTSSKDEKYCWNTISRLLHHS